MKPEELLPEVMAQFALDPDGLHGLPHWARVLENALRLAKDTDVNLEVLELFAILHDSRRISDGEDRDHGLRSADFALYCRDRGYLLDDAYFSKLHLAIVGHSKPCSDPGDETIRICWDAEQLDLGRLGITPRSSCMYTEAARDPAVIAWSGNRSRHGHVPNLVTNRWQQYRQLDGRAI
ncbi:hypothetical protein KKA85_06840 [bacterium]|nr:hypothetical protein [bacterium]MBU1675481.1 hypothetical protein [bacterium]